MFAKRVLTSVPKRVFAVRAYSSEGATGATRSDGSSDSFTVSYLITDH